MLPRLFSENTPDPTGARRPRGRRLEMAEQRQRRTGSSGRMQNLSQERKKKMSEGKLKNRQKAQLKQKSNQATVSLTESFNGDQNCNTLQQYR